MSDVLKNLTLEYWYKALLAISFAILIVALTIPLQVSNKAVAVLAVAGGAIGFGEWLNHPYREAVDLRAGFKISGHMRNNCLLGVALDIVGAALFCLGVYRLL